MTIREAKIEDIKQIQIVRNSVTENTLSNPDLVTDQDCEEFITVRGKGWVCEIDKQIVGFAKNKGKGALMNTNAIGKTGGDLPHNNMMPFLALNYYINAGGYASQNKY